MKLFRKILFWTHLVIGLAAGLVIAVMAFTGASMAFEPQIIAALERDVRFVAPPAPDATRLPIDELVQRLRAQTPDARPQSITVSADPAATVVLSLGRDRMYYANPYTGEILQPSARSQQAREIFHFLEFTHRWLAREGDQRAIGRAITGAADLVFLALAVSGLWLWWPRNKSWRALRPSIWFTRGARGKARDWNWHNVIGLWASPVIIVTTLTGAVMSYRWANDLLFRAVGSTPPAPRAEGQNPNATPPAEITRPEGARPLGFDALLAAARAEAPADWSTISIRTAPMQRRGPAPADADTARSSSATLATSRSSSASAAESPGPRNTPEASGRRGGPGRTVQPVTASIRADSLPAPLQLTLNPYTAGILRTQTPATPDLGRRLRAAVKPLHTGTLGGWPHQTIMFLSAVGALVLVYTGFALAFRRFFKGKPRPPAATSAPTRTSAQAPAAAK